MIPALRILLIPLMSFVLLSNLTLADVIVNDKVVLDGNIRYRLEIDGKDFNNNTGMHDYSLLRTLFGIKIDVNDKLALRIKFKDSRYLGTSGSNQKSTSFFDLQEGYIEVKEIFNHPLTLQLGRYEFLYGRRRIHGNGIWNNFGPRTYDGFRLIWTNPVSRVDFFFARIVERSFLNQPLYTNDSYDSRDRNLFGIYGEFCKKRIQPLLVLDWDNRNELQNADLVITSAVYINSRTNRFDIDCDAGYQFGKKSDNDLSSWLFAADIKYKFEGKSKIWVGAGADITSGNDSDDLLTGEDHIFYTPFMSRHAFKGFMDFYTDVETGLIDLILRTGFSPFKPTTVQVDLHSFSSMESMINNEGEKYNLMGQEIDLRLRSELWENLELDTAICTYIPTEDWVPNGNPAYFYYLTIIGKI